MTTTLRVASEGALHDADVMLRRRVLSMEDFMKEKLSGRKLTRQECVKLYGSRTAPIPVPLVPGETEEQYEASYAAHTANVPASQRNDVAKERVRRCLYAMHRYNEYRKTHHSHRSSGTPQATTGDDAESQRVSHTARAQQNELLVQRCIELEDHRTNVRNGLFTNIDSMSSDERERAFGAPIVPIYMPLARGETKDLYEDRFVEWLWEKEALTMEELTKKPMRERHLRIKFAKANTSGEEYFVPASCAAKRPQDDSKQQSSSQKKQKQHAAVNDLPAVSPRERLLNGKCNGGDTISSAIVCGCRQCLAMGMRLLAGKMDRIKDMERSNRDLQKSTNPDAKEVVDLTSDNEASEPLTLSTPTHNDASTAVDHIEISLMNAYDTINEQIVMNEKVVEGSTSQIVSAPVDNVKITMQIQDENEEMRELIRDEMLKRSLAVAVLAVYLWRNQIYDLKKMTTNPNATSTVYVQRAAHHKCATLAKGIALKRQEISQTKAQLEAGYVDQSFDADERQSEETKLEALQTDLRQLHELRRREFVKLIFFDQHLRGLIQALLRRL